MAHRKVVQCHYSGCDETFVPERKSGKYCSVKHRVYAARERKLTPVEKVTPIVEKKDPIPEKQKTRTAICEHGALKGYCQYGCIHEE